jgi:hypothetical protein
MEVSCPAITAAWEPAAQDRTSLAVTITKTNKFSSQTTCTQQEHSYKPSCKNTFQRQQCSPITSSQQPGNLRTAVVFNLNTLVEPVLVVASDGMCHHHESATVGAVALGKHQVYFFLAVTLNSAQHRRQVQSGIAW